MARPTSIELSSEGRGVLESIQHFTTDALTSRSEYRDGVLSSSHTSVAFVFFLGSSGPTEMASAHATSMGLDTNPAKQSHVL